MILTLNTYAFLTRMNKKSNKNRIAKKNIFSKNKGK